jgi:hypothetical protein
LQTMGCHSGKTSPPAAAKQPEAKNTLLAPGAQTQSPAKDAVKAEAPAEVAADVAEPSGIFNGVWCHGVINGNVLTWNDASISQICIDDMTRVIEVTYDGVSYSGELRADDQIYWNDGDIWSRQLAPANAEDSPATTPALTVTELRENAGHHLPTITEISVETLPEQLNAVKEAPAESAKAPASAQGIVPASGSSDAVAVPASVASTAITSPPEVTPSVKSNPLTEPRRDHPQPQRRERSMCCC